MIWLGLLILSVILIPVYTRMFYQKNERYNPIKEAEEILKSLKSKGDKS